MKPAGWLLLIVALILTLGLGLALGVGAFRYAFPGGMMGGRGYFGDPGGMIRTWSLGPTELLLIGLITPIPVALLAIGTAGPVWLIRQAARPPALPVTDGRCPNCGKDVQPDWRKCPHCGQDVRRKP